MGLGGREIVILEMIENDREDREVTGLGALEHYLGPLVRKGIMEVGELTKGCSSHSQCSHTAPVVSSLVLLVLDVEWEKINRLVRSLYLLSGCRLKDISGRAM